MKYRPDLLIMDVGLPDMNGIDATRKVIRHCPDTKVICLSMHDERQIVVSMLRAGASGYLIKNCAGRELMDAIRAVSAGRKWVSPAVSGELVHEYVVSNEKDSECICRELTEREREILQHIAEGKNTKEIGELLHISDKTVAAHRLKLMEKTDCASVADLTRYAIRQGLIRP
jgi:DNA-binding NarL/FixJ family response regulator